MRLLDQLVTLLRAEYTTDSQMISLLNYMLHSGHTDQPKVFYRELASRTPQGESMMTLAEWFEEQGMQKGIQQGIQKGIQQGIQKGETEAARRVAARMLKNGMSAELVAQMTDLTAEEIEQLTNWR